MATRNPTWVRDELILALDMYLRCAGHAGLAADLTDCRDTPVLDRDIGAPRLTPETIPNRRPADHPIVYPSPPAQFAESKPGAQLRVAHTADWSGTAPSGVESSCAIAEASIRWMNEPRTEPRRNPPAPRSVPLASVTDQSRSAMPSRRIVA